MLLDFSYGAPYTIPSIPGVFNPPAPNTMYPPADQLDYEEGNVNRWLSGASQASDL